uniref:Uncharacterized protein n=1 Tax=Rhizophora mucronata TaxID=61149 RepID=A0A2P2P7W7_RHIMU
MKLFKSRNLQGYFDQWHTRNRRSRMIIFFYIEKMGKYISERESKSQGYKLG